MDVFYRAVMLCGVSFAALSAEAQSQQGDSVRTLPTAEVTARQGLWRNDRADMVQQSSGEQMAQAGLWGVADAVKRFAGATVRDYGGIGGMKTVGVRGAGATHTAVSYGGIVVSNTQAGQIDIGRFSTATLESVALSMGQADRSLLSARHLASVAVVEINPRDPLITPDKNRNAAQLSAGSYGFLDIGLSHTALITKNIGIAATAFYNRADGNYPFTLHNGSKVTREKREGSDVEALKGELTLAATTQKGRLDACLNYYRSERGLPGGVILYAEEAHERLWDEHWSAQMLWQTNMSEKWRMAIRAKYAHSWNKYEDIDVKYSGGKLTDIYHQSEYYSAASIEWTPTQWLRATLAEDIAVATLKSNVDNQPDPVRLSSLTALRLEATYRRLKADAYATITLMDDHARSTKEAKTTVYSLSERVPQPSIGLSYRLMRSEKLYLRGRLKYTFRVPTFTDMYYLHIGNTNLKPERARMWSVGLAWTKAFGTWIDCSLACDGYLTRVSDKIVVFPTTYVWRMRNVGLTRTRGLDMAFEIQMKPYRELRLSLGGAYTYQDSRDITDSRQSYYKNLLPYSPHHQGSSTLALGYRRMSLTAEWIFASSRYSSQQNTAEYRIKPYNELNLTLSSSIEIRNTRLWGSLSLLNVADSQYEVVKYYPMPGRNIRATVKIEF